MTGHERSRQAMEHASQVFLHEQEEHRKTKPTEKPREATHQASEQEIAALAYELWQARNCPEGSPEEDWFRAVESLRAGR